MAVNTVLPILEIMSSQGYTMSRLQTMSSLFTPILGVIVNFLPVGPSCADRRFESVRLRNKNACAQPLSCVFTHCCYCHVRGGECGQLIILDAINRSWLQLTTIGSCSLGYFGKILKQFAIDTTNSCLLRTLEDITFTCNPSYLLKHLSVYFITVYGDLGNQVARIF